MAVSLATMRNRLRVMLNDLDRPDDEVIGVLKLDGAIANAYIACGAVIMPPKLFTASGLTIAANAQTFSMPTTTGAEYSGDVRIRLQSDGSFLNRCTREEIEAFRFGETATTGTGRPFLFSLYEDSSQTVQGDVWPRSRDSEVCDTWVGLNITDLRDAASMDAANIQFSRFGSTGLLYRAAAELLAGMPRALAEARDLDKDVVQEWREQSRVLLYAEEVRRNQAEDAGRVQRWVS